jgi:O-antigen/teichoic acid export membrane protein
MLVAALARYLGVKGLGQYALVFAYVAMLTGIFSDWGIGTICLREISRSRESRVELIGSAATLQAIFAVASYLILLLSLLLVPYPHVVVTSVALYGLSILLSPLDILALPFQADLQIKRLIVPALSGSLLTFTITITVIWLRGPLLALVGAALMGQLVQYGWVTIISIRNLKGLRPSWSGWTFYLSEGWSLGLATIGGAFFQQAPVLGLSLLSIEGVGLFNAANRVTQQLTLLPLIVRVSTFPILSEAWVVDRLRFSRLLRRILGASLLVSIPVAILGIGLAEPLARALFGPAFSASALPFKLLMGAFAIMFPAILTGEAMVAAGFQRANMLVNMAAVPVLIALLVWLVPLGSAAGTAAAVLATNAFIAAGTVLAARRLLRGPISFKPLLVGIGAAAVGAGILVLARDLGSVPAALLAATATAIVVGTMERSTVLLLWGLHPFRSSVQA